MFAWDKSILFGRVAIIVLLDYSLLLDCSLLLVKAYIKFRWCVYIILTLIYIICFYNVLDKLSLIFECIAQIFLEVSNIHTLWFLGVFISLSFIVLTYYHKLWDKYPRLYLVGNIICFIFIAFSLWANKEIIFNIIQLFDSYILKILGGDKDKPKDNNTPGDPNNNGDPNPGGNDKPPLNKSPEKKKRKKKETIEETNRKRREAEKIRKDNRGPNEKTPYQKVKERDIERKKRGREAFGEYYEEMDPEELMRRVQSNRREKERLERFELENRERLARENRERLEREDRERLIRMAREVEEEINKNRPDYDPDDPYDLYKE